MNTFQLYHYLARYKIIIYSSTPRGDSIQHQKKERKWHRLSYQSFRQIFLFVYYLMRNTASPCCLNGFLLWLLLVIIVMLLCTAVAVRIPTLWRFKGGSVNADLKEKIKTFPHATKNFHPTRKTHYIFKNKNKTF